MRSRACPPCAPSVGVVSVDSSFRLRPTKETLLVGSVTRKERTRALAVP